MGLTVSTFLKDGSGTTAIEYSLIAALVSIVAVAAMTAMSGSVINTLGFADSTLHTACASVGLC